MLICPNSYLYWTSRSTTDGYGEAIHRMNLKNLNEVNRLDIPGHRKIDKLVIDPPYLYWINRGNKDDVMIEQYNLSNTDSNSGAIKIIVDFADNVTGMYMCSIQYTVCLHALLIFQC